MNQKGARQAALAVVLSLGLGSAAAAPIAEVEPNDPINSAQTAASNAMSFEIAAERTFADPSDDFFRFYVRRPGLLNIVASSSDASADSVMGLYGPGGTLLASNDDAAVGNLMSAISFMATVAGYYTVGLSGFNPILLTCAGMVTRCYDTNDDFLFDTYVPSVSPGQSFPGGSTDWSYTLSLNGAGLLPEPGTLLLLALGAPLLLAGRKRPSQTGARTA